MWNPALGLLLVISLGVSVVDAWKAESSAIATVTPCPSASATSTPAPITVTAQYQPVSTCEYLSEICIKRQCWTQYTYSTYDFVSTVIPCPVAAPSSVTTVTGTDQSVLVSRAAETITNTHVTSTVIRKWKPTTVIQTLSTYTTLVKEWSAEYKDLGPLAIPGYDGSGICTQCWGSNKQQFQPLNVLECASTLDEATVCRQYSEVWVFGSSLGLTRTASAVCSTQTSVAAAGVYVFEFVNHAPPATVQVPAQTVTYTVGGPDSRVLTSISIATTTVVPGEDWTATITRNCPQPTVIDFEVIVTKVIEFVVPPIIFPDGP